MAVSILRCCAVLLAPLHFGCAVASVPIDSSASTGPGGSVTAASGAGSGGSSAGSGSSTGSSGSGAGGSAGVSIGGEVPTGEWVNVTGNLAGLASECGNLTYLSAKPDEDVLIAGIAQQGLWTSTEGGTTWRRLGQAPGSAKIVNRPSSIVYDPQNPGRFWESGIYNAGGVFETTDNGATFVQRGENVTHVDLVAIDFTDPERKTLLAGSHEQSKTLYRSTDGGTTWDQIGSALPAEKGCTFPFVVDANTHLIGCGGPYGPGGVFRSTDGARSWVEVSAGGGGSSPLRASDGTIWWAGPTNHGLIGSTDDGLTWTELTPYGPVDYFSPVELPDRRVAMLSRTHYVVVSSDHGTTWRYASSALPFGDPSGLAYSARRKAFYVWRLTCGPGSEFVPADGIMRYDFD